MSQQTLPKAQHPIILRYHRLLEAFSKSDDERDFYLDKVEGFLVYIDLDKDNDEIEAVTNEVEENDRYVAVPKLTYYETKKFMEGFVNEKVYDIDVKEKLLDIIQAREARENFLEFIYDHLTELDKWQQYYHERSRIRIIEWLRNHNIRFVFEEDVEIPQPVMEKVKLQTFDEKVAKDVQGARATLETKSATYYSSEALNPRPKRGRPPKQATKVEVEPQFVSDIYKTVPQHVRPFLFVPEYKGNAVTFSTKFETEEQLLASLRGSPKDKVDTRLELLSQRLESLRHLSGRLKGMQLPDLDKSSSSLSSSDISSLEGEESTSTLSKIAKGLLPQSADKKKADKSKEKQKKVKTVTQIQYSKKKKKGS